MKNYTALIIDLKSSRSYTVADRNSIQYFIIKVINCLNEMFSNSLIRNVTFSAGDEVQGLFDSPESAYLYLRMFHMLVFPIKIRAGIGIGEWNVKIENESTTAQDGPVYHNARNAIENIKNTLEYFVLMYSGTDNDIFINEIINIAFTLVSDHSLYQNELMLLAESLYPIDYHNTINLSKISLISELVRCKNELEYYMCYKKSGSVVKYPFDRIEIISSDFLSTDAGSNESTFYVSNGKKRGMTSQLSKILNVSRQSIEKTFKTADIFEARNSTVVALKFMDKYF